jgi:hypothetical protein
LPLVNTLELLRTIPSFTASSASNTKLIGLPNTLSLRTLAKLAKVSNLHSNNDLSLTVSSQSDPALSQELLETVEATVRQRRISLC